MQRMPPAPLTARVRRWAFAVAGATFAFGAVPAAAHLGSTKYIHAVTTDRGAHLDVDVDAVDASVENGLGPTPDPSALHAHAATVAAWITHGIRVRSEGGPCAPHAGDIRMTGRDGRPFVTVPVNYVCPAPVRGLVLHDDTIFDADPRHEAIVRLGGAGRPEQAEVLRAGSREVALGSPPTTVGVLEEFLVEGMIHLATGYDHMLFLLSLILAAGFVVVRSGMRKALRDVGILVTSFTIGHSFTLIAAALRVIVLPSRPVEALIAASIVAVALHNVIKPEERASMPWMAFFFGLVHGLGFSSVLVSLGLPAEQTVLALVSFNVGIEVAQLAFVSLALGPIAWIAKSRIYRPVVVRGGSLAIALVASVWLVERVIG